MDFIGIAGDVSNIARIFLLKSTRGSYPAPESKPPRVFKLLGPLARALKSAEPIQEKSAAEEMVAPEPAGNAESSAKAEGEVLVDEPRRRLWVERFGFATLIMRSAALVLAAVYSGYYFDGIKNHDDAVTAQYLRCGELRTN